jgi:CrcB protein
MQGSPFLLVWVAAGGAIGAVARYLVMSQVGHWLGSGFPYATLTVNLVGSFVLGVLVESMALLWQPPAGLRALLVVGMLGAFTTFSTFSMDVALLMEKHQQAEAWLYIVASVGLCVAAMFVGMHLMRTVLA